MDNSQIITVLVLLVVVALAAALFLRKRRSDSLRQRFGPEYETAVQRTGDRAQAEAELAAREKRVAKLDLRPLPEPERRRFADVWRQTQAHFVV